MSACICVRPRVPTCYPACMPSPEPQHPIFRLANMSHACLNACFPAPPAAPRQVQNSIEGWFAGNSIPGDMKSVDRPHLKKLYHRCAVDAEQQGAATNRRCGGGPA